MIITIDGPVASGKSSVARCIARDLGFFYINSGLLFRTYAYVLMRDALLSQQQLARVLSGQIEIVDLDELCYVIENGAEQVIYKGENITHELRSGTVSQASSIIATNTVVRALVLAYERFLASQHANIVIDGRDTGSIVFPQAELKIYLTAQPAVRAKWWQLDQEKRGVKLTFEQALDEVNARDIRDKNRSVAPLMQPDDAQVIDSSGLTIKEVVHKIKNLVDTLT